MALISRLCFFLWLCYSYVINDNDGNIERLLAGWKYCNLYYFYTIDFFNLNIFLSHFRTKGYNNIMTMSYNVLAQGYSLSFDAKWDVSWCKLALSIFYLAATFYIHYEMHFLPFMLNFTYIYSFFFLVN